jgi:HPt (histidine-containing phosphotransfer) domain-containing protein
MGNPAEPNIEIFNLTQALQSVGGDWEFLTEIAGLVQAAWPTLLSDLKESIARGDVRGVETRARLAKAAARNVSASRTYECALEIEAMTAKGDLLAAQEAIAKLEEEATLLQLALSTIAIAGGGA